MLFLLLLMVSRKKVANADADSVILDAPKKKPYDVAYKVKTLREIVDMQKSEVKKVQMLLEVPVSQLPSIYTEV